jgi:peroxiredoxin
MIELYDIKTSEGDTLGDLSKQQPVLLVFLRQLGCMFCREGMTKLGELRQSIEHGGTKIVLVHMADTDKKARVVLKKYKLDTCATIADAPCMYYARFGLLRSSFSQLFGFSTWVKSADYAFNKGHGFHLPIGDGFQLPGLFMLHEGQILETYRAETVEEQPPYEAFINCCMPNK